uniref:CrV1-like protein n=1 Tax=Cotesia congregata TaxID=51543 RepID=Q8T7V4_COTCN|nr:CrV1-like protein [Cotesia congregata]
MLTLLALVYRYAAYPYQYQWERIRDNPFADVARLSQQIDNSFTKSDPLAERVMPPTNDFDESDKYNRESFMIPKSYSWAPPKGPAFMRHPMPDYHIRPEYSTRHRAPFTTRPFVRPISGLSSGSSGIGRPGSIVANGIFSGPGRFVGNLKFTQPELFDTSRTHQHEYESETSEKRHITREDLFSELHAIKEALQKLTSAVIRIENEISFKTFTTLPQPPVLIDPIVASDLQPKEPSKEGVTYPTFTTSPQPPVLIDPIVASDLQPKEPSKEGVTYPTFTTSPQPPVLIDPIVASDLQPKEPSKEGVTYPTFTTSPQPPVLIDPIVASDLQPKEPSKEGVTYPTFTTSTQPPVLINSSRASELGPIEANNEKGVNYPTVTSSTKPPVSIDSNMASEINSVESTYESMYKNTATNEEPFVNRLLENTLSKTHFSSIS